MYNAYEHEPNGIASGKKYDYCEYRRGHESGEPKVKTDFFVACFEGANYTLYCNRNFYAYNV